MAHGLLERIVRGHSDLVARNVERAVKHPKDVDVSIFSHEVGDPLVSVEKDADISRRREVSVTDLGMGLEHLGALKDSLGRLRRRHGVVRGDEVIDVGEPPLSLVRPCYFGHN